MGVMMGLVFTLGAHSTRIVADGWRIAMIGRLGEISWKALFALLSIAGFGLVVWGFGLARQQPLELWWPPFFMRPVAWVLMLFAFMLLAAASVPRNAIKARLHHPMVLRVMVWALAHVRFFCSFLLWSVLSSRAARKRDLASTTIYPAATVFGTVLTTVAGIAAWAVFAFWAHGLLIGIRPVWWRWLGFPPTVVNSWVALADRRYIKHAPLFRIVKKLLVVSACLR
ncbi:MAG: NnrU family protein [Polaromonas sp.]|nr:NnrU family protein [Polaromonas sp.]